MNFLKSTSIHRTASLKGLQILYLPAISRGISSEPPRRPFSTSQSQTMASDLDPRAKWTVTVPEKQAYVIERGGKYLRTLFTGTHSLMPTTDRIAHVHSLEEKVIEVKTNPARSSNVVSSRIVSFTGLVYVRIVDPYLASYHNKPQFSIPLVAKLAQARVSKRIRDIKLDLIVNEIPEPMLNVSADSIFIEEVFSAIEKDESILEYINQIAKGWGLMCSGFKVYGVKDFHDGLEKLLIEAEECVRRRRNLVVLVELQNRANVLSGLIEQKKKGDGEERKVIIRRAREEAASILSTMESLSKKK